MPRRALGLNHLREPAPELTQSPPNHNRRRSAVLPDGQGALALSGKPLVAPVGPSVAETTPSVVRLFGFSRARTTLPVVAGELSLTKLADGEERRFRAAPHARRSCFASPRYRHLEPPLPVVAVLPTLVDAGRFVAALPALGVT
jgi:hypothetical protein